MLALAKIGDKFVIEVDKVFTESNNGNHLYRIKGFNSLVFDDNGIKKLNEMQTEKEVHVGGRYENNDGKALVVISKKGNSVSCVSIPDGEVVVLPVRPFLDSYKYNGEDFSHEIGVILGDLPF